MDLIRHRMLLNLALQREQTKKEDIIIYDYSVSPSSLSNGSVISYSGSSMSPTPLFGDAGISLSNYGSSRDTGVSFAVLGSYNLTGYSALEIVGGKKDYNMTSLYVAILNPQGAVMRSIDLLSIIVSNSLSGFTAANGGYSTHCLDVSDLNGECQIRLYMSCSGNGSNKAAFKRLALITAESPTAQYDRIIISGSGDSSKGCVKIDNKTYYQSTVLNLSAGTHYLEANAYRIIVNGETLEASGGKSDVYVYGKYFTGSVSISITREETGGFFTTVYYVITINYQ